MMRGERGERRLQRMRGEKDGVGGGAEEEEEELEQKQEQNRWCVVFQSQGKHWKIIAEVFLRLINIYHCA